MMILNKESFSCISEVDLEDVAWSLVCYKTSKKDVLQYSEYWLGFSRLCKPCAHYLLESKTNVNDYWAALIWRFLFRAAYMILSWKEV
jgi:hypothetical protein